MNATITTSNDGLRLSDRAERHYCGGYIGLALKDGGAVPAVDLKLYTTDARTYCCVWLAGEVHQSGSSHVGGYGYHKASAAAGRAIRAAGVSLSEDIDGRGDGAIRDAVEAIAAAMYPGCTVYVVHAHA